MAESYFIAKVYRQHNSLVIAVPRAVCTVLGLKRGDHMIFTWQQSEGKFKFSKFRPEGAKEHGDKTNTVVTDRGGRT